MITPLLEVHSVSKHFGGPPVLQDVSLAVRPGEILAVVGENGAGKSTLMKVISGVHRPDQGHLVWKGTRTQLLSPQHGHRLGISVVYQELNLVPELTVAENLFLGHELRRFSRVPGFSLLDKARMSALAEEALLRVGARAISPRQRVSSFSQANRQLVEIAKALTRNSDLLILDEPTSSLSPPEVEALMGVMQSLQDQGCAILFITHRLEEVTRVADRTVVLRDGRVVGELTREATQVETLVRLMVGRPLDQMYVREPHTPGRVVLEVQGLGVNGVFHDISFALREGEILGVAGLVGAGRSDVARAIFGTRPADAGHIRVNGKAVRIRSPLDAIRLGIALVPEDRKTQGILAHMSVLENVGTPWLRHLTRLGLVRWKSVRELAREQVGSLGVRPANIERPLAHFSGGNQQKVVLGKWLSRPPRILILDEPTRGVDVGAKNEIYRTISRLAREGMAILLISSELPEVLGLSDRVLVMANGRVMAELDNKGLTQEQIMSAATVGRK